MSTSESLLLYLNLYFTLFGPVVPSQVEVPAVAGMLDRDPSDTFNKLSFIRDEGGTASVLANGCFELFQVFDLANPSFLRFSGMPSTSNRALLG